MIRTWVLNTAERLRTSYWFVPTVMAIGAILLAGGMIALDSRDGSQWMDRFSWLQASRPDGARQVLSSIGGSMITVAGTVFSVTIAAVVYASGQYGPRLLSNFMSDRGNQFTLGTFIATFLYCLLVLRTVRSPEESGGDGFVPNMALLVGVLLALCSIAVLIFFIHHVPSKIHINNVIKDIGTRLLDEVGDRFPDAIGRPHDADDTPDVRLPRTFRKGASAIEADDRRLIRSTNTGYIQMVDDALLMEVAAKHDLIIRLQFQPGDFIHERRVLAEAWPPGTCDDDAAEAIADAFSVSARRTALQDLRFLIDELVEIAARALSPGVNDPFTAITCLDWLGAAMSDLAGRDLPSNLRVDDDGALRIIAHPVTFGRFIDRSFGALLQYAAGDMVAALGFLNALGQVALGCEDATRVASVAEQVDRLEELANDALAGANRTRVLARAADLRRALADPDYRRMLRDSTAWLGGSA